jgi:acetolactate decarboxylase
MKRMFCVVTMLCVLASCVTVHAEENAATLDGTNGDVLYQVELIQSLVQGYYDGIITVGELKQHGDTGIGTFEGLNGEMIVLDGTVYQAVADGSITIPADEETVPSGSVTFFDTDKTLTLIGISDMAALQESVE